MAERLRVATWNVNGIRARGLQVHAWLDREAPDVVCLQELKATVEQVPPELAERPDYASLWHGAGPYSGVALCVRRDRYPAPPVAEHPSFDLEQRVVTARLGETLVASVYVPNGGKDYAAKLVFLERMIAWAADLAAKGERLILGGDLNVAREERDVHPKERKAGAVGQRPEERVLLERLAAEGQLVDLGRALDPDNDALFTWWAPWRNLRQRNIGWRIDYLLASRSLAVNARSAEVQREVGTSDHAPVLVDFEDL